MSASTQTNGSRAGESLTRKMLNLRRNAAELFRGIHPVATTRVASLVTNDRIVSADPVEPRHEAGDSSPVPCPYCGEPLRAGADAARLRLRFECERCGEFPIFRTEHP
jgi:hypothetical protein